MAAQDGINEGNLVLADERKIACQENYSLRAPSQSRVCQSPDQSDSTLPLTVSPVILPLYLAVTFRPSRSRMTLKVISSPAILPSRIWVSFSLRTVTPVSLSSSCFSLSVPSMRV